MNRWWTARYRVRYGVICGLIFCLPQANAESDAQKGRALAMDRQKGNCLACHQIADGKFPGTIGPPLLNMRDRFVQPQRLFDQIWDATRFNEESVMPPYGRNKILTDEEIRHIVAFLYTL